MMLGEGKLFWLDDLCCFKHVPETAVGTKDQRGERCRRRAHLGSDHSDSGHFRKLGRHWGGSPGCPHCKDMGSVQHFLNLSEQTSASEVRFGRRSLAYRHNAIDFPCTWAKAMLGAERNEIRGPQKLWGVSTDVAAIGQLNSLLEKWDLAPLSHHSILAREEASTFCWLPGVSRCKCQGLAL